MRFVSINKLVNELKVLYPTAETLQLLVNVKLFHEDKYKNMQGPILLVKVNKKEDKPETLTFTDLIQKFGEEIIIKLNFPHDNKANYLICTINTEQKTSQLGPFYERSYSNVGDQTIKKAQELTAEYAKIQSKIGEAIEL